MRRITKNILFVFGGDVLSRLLGFLSTIWLARVLGANGFGSLSFAFTFFGYALLFTDLGLSSLGTREIAKSPNHSRDFIAKITPLRFSLAAIAFSIITILSLTVPGMAQIRLLIILYCLSVFPYSVSLIWFYRGVEEMKFIGISTITSYSLYLILVVLFVRSIGDINLVPIFWFIGSAVSASYLAFKAIGRRELSRDKPRLEINRMVILRKALPIGVGTIMTQIYFNFDITMLGFIRGTTDAGIYTVAYKLLMFLLLIDGVFSTVILPLISRFYKESPERLKEILSLAAKVITIIVTPICAGGTLLAQPIIRLVFGESYITAALVFQILIWTLAITTIGSIYTQGLIAIGLERRYATAIVSGTALNVILNIFMIPTLGIIGAAVATICSEILMFVLMMRVFNTVVKVRVLPFIGKPILSSVIMCAVLYILRNLNVGVLILIGIAIYASVLYLIKGITKGELRYLFKPQETQNITF